MESFSVVLMAASPKVPFDLRLSAARGGVSMTPAKVADATLCTEEQCLMRKTWNPDEFPQRGRGGESSC